MTPLDITLLVILAGFVASGFATGFVQSLGAIIGLFVGAFFAGQLYPTVAKVILPWVSGGQNVADIVGFIIVFIVISQVVGFVFRTLNMLFKFITLIPGIKFLDHLLGALLSLIQGVIFLGLILAFASRLPLTSFGIDVMNRSQLAPPLIAIGGWLIVFLPGAIKQAQSIIKK